MRGHEYTRICLSSNGEFVSYGLEDHRTSYKQYIVMARIRPGKYCSFVNTLADSVQIFAIKSRLVAPPYGGHSPA